MTRTTRVERDHSCELMNSLAGTTERRLVSARRNGKYYDVRRTSADLSFATAIAGCLSSASEEASEGVWTTAMSSTTLHLLQLTLTTKQVTAG